MKETYNNFLKVLNINEEDFLNEINSYPVFYCYEDKVKISESDIEGVGCFTLKDFSKEDLVGTVLYGNYKTELGRYVNHTSDPNIYLKDNKFYALKNISVGEELLVNYFENLKHLLNE